MDTNTLVLRPEEPRDHRVVEALVRDAFWNLQVPGCDEHFLVHRVREHGDFLPALTFVAEHEGRLVGYVMTTRSRLVAGDRALPTITMGPIAVHPEWQRRGVGRRLVEHVIARATGYAAVVILGHPHNYVGYGFRNGKDLGIAAEDGSHPLGLLAIAFDADALKGASWRVRFSEVFEPVDGLEAFDATFEPREKAWQPSQELFAMVIRAHVD
ncbi:MAG: N-acetyltransferase [Polyangiales bacterium]|nr:N-acetyltransferase [Myxococcales bacterium]